MSSAVRMPDIGTVESEVTFVRWLKKEGEAVALGEPLFEVETDKGVSQVEAAIAGVLLRCVAKEGAAVAAGETIAHIGKPGDGGGESAAIPATPAPATPRIAPALRALAAKWTVDIDALAASKPGGIVTREEILRAGKERAQGGTAPAAAPPAAARALSRNQAIVARKVSQSYRDKPHYRVSALVDMTAVTAHREAGRSAGDAPSYDAILCKVVSRAVAEQPLFRQYLVGEVLKEHPAVDVAVALGVGDELYAPAVRGAASMDTAKITRAIRELAEKAQAHSLTAQDVDGSCILVSNLGMYPIESFDAIIYPEHSAALAVGATARTPMAEGEGVRVAPMAHLTLSVDHRLINGTAAARFLARVKELLETGAFA